MQNAASFKRKMQFHVKIFTKKNTKEKKYIKKKPKEKKIVPLPLDFDHNKRKKITKQKNYNKKIHNKIQKKINHTTL